jgi:hypothetical protein
MRLQRFSLGVAGVLAAGLFSLTAHANAGGKIGFSGKTSGQTCVQACHSANASTVATTVTLEGPATLTAGATGDYTLIITGGPAAKAGMNVAVSNGGGTLSVAGSDLKVDTGELTHTAAKAFSNNEVRFNFKLVAPSAAGTVTLFGTGNSVNGDGNLTGDNSASTTKQIQVTSSTTENPDGDGADKDEGGCAAAGGAPMVMLLALVATRLRRRGA